MSSTDLTMNNHPTATHAPKRAPRPTVDALAAPQALLRIDTVQALVGLSRTHLYRLLAQGRFPEPVRLGARCTRWRAGAVSDWLDAQG